MLSLNFHNLFPMTCIHAKSLQSWPTLWPVACQAPLPMGFSRQEYWSGLSCPLPGESSWSRGRTRLSYHLLHRQAGSLPLAPPGKPNTHQKWLLWSQEGRMMVFLRAGGILWSLCSLNDVLLYLVPPSISGWHNFDDFEDFALALLGSVALLCNWASPGSL